MLNELLTLIVFLILSSILIIAVIGIFIYQMYRENRYTPQIAIAMGFSFIAIILAVGDIFFQNSSEYNYSIFLSKSIAVSIAYLFLYYHYEALIRRLPDKRREMSVFGITVLSVGISILKLAGIIPVFITIRMIPLDAIDAFLGIIVFSFSTYVMSKINSRIRNKNTLLELVSQIMLLVANILWVVAEFIWSIYQMSGIRAYTILTLFGTLFIFLGIMLLTVNYFSNVEYLYQVPISIHSISIINPGGTLVYSRKVSSKGNPEVKFDEMLLSNVLFAIHTLMGEVFDRKVSFRSIRLEGYLIYFTLLKDNYILALLTSQTNFFIKKSIERIRDNIEQIKFPALSEPVDPEYFYNKIDPIINKAFPYLKFEKSKLFIDYLD